MRDSHLHALTALASATKPLVDRTWKGSFVVKLAANLSMMFTELPFLERFPAAAHAGFKAIEFMFPYETPAQDVADLLERHNLALALFNMPAGDWSAGERGIGALPDRVDEFRRNAETALDYARILGCKRLHLMAGKSPPDSNAACRETLIGNVRFAADLVGADAIDILLEPINTRVDIPGYFYDRTETAIDIITAADRKNVKLQYDIYHMQIMEGDLARSIERLLPIIGHLQLADNPGRGEPGTGEINYPWLLSRIDMLGYDGYIGCEYRPAGETMQGLGWAQPYLAE
jgi:hydroxypyruvate isomerase